MELKIGIKIPEKKVYFKLELVKQCSTEDVCLFFNIILNSIINIKDMIYSIT